MMKEWIAIGANHIERGAVELETWRSRVRSEVGHGVEPYLPEIWQWALIMMYHNRGRTYGKINCWEVMKCGKTGLGIRGRFQEICPARLEARLDGIHGGRNGGRACWVIENTLCGGKRPETTEVKRAGCASCKFFLQVHAEERRDLIVADTYLSSLLS